MKKELCVNCGGILIKQLVEYEKTVGSKKMLFEDVPALVCSCCDEIWIDGKVAEKMERIFKKNIKPKRYITLPVWSLSRAS
jgi:YgiT-type zinc finger domain-containing protein